MEILSPGAMIGNQRAGVAGRESGKQNVFRQLVSLLLPMVLLGPGCTATSSFLSFAGVDKPTGAPCRVAVMWIPEVRLTPDVVHGGARVPSLGGRVYLFGEEIKYPIVCEGRIVVDLFGEQTFNAVAHFGALGFAVAAVAMMGALGGAYASLRALAASASRRRG